MLAFATATALLLTALLFLSAVSALPREPGAVGLAVAITLVAASVEGWAGIAETLWRGLPFDSLRDLNIDALAAWAFKGLRIDNLPRTFWYTPQHGFACALGLIALPVAIEGGVSVGLAATLLAGCALGASVAFNPLIGGAFALAYGLTHLMASVRDRSGLAPVFRHAWAAAPVVVALGWCALNEVGDGAGQVLHLGFWGLARQQTVLTFVSQVGPLLPLVLAAWWLTRAERVRLWPAVWVAVIGGLVMHLVALTVDLAWVGFRGGNLLFMAAPTLVAGGIVSLRRQRPSFARALVALVLVAGLPTTLIDVFNAQDVSNDRTSRAAERARGTTAAFDPSQEFHWTATLTPAQQEALAWIKRSTPRDAVVQMEPIVRGRDQWTVIPTFAERRMAAATPVPLPLNLDEGRRQRIRLIYEGPDAEAAWADAKALGIDYLYVDTPERSAYPAVVKFDATPARFTRVFANAEVQVFAVRP